MAQHNDPRYPGKVFGDWEYIEYPKYLGDDAHGRAVIARDSIHEDEVKKLAVKKSALHPDVDVSVPVAKHSFAP